MKLQSDRGSEEYGYLSYLFGTHPDGESASHCTKKSCR